MQRLLSVVLVLVAGAIAWTSDGTSALAANGPRSGGALQTRNQTRLQDGSCRAFAAPTWSQYQNQTRTQARLRGWGQGAGTRDQTRDRLQDGSCRGVATPTWSQYQNQARTQARLRGWGQGGGTRDQDQIRDRLQDGSCLQ